MAWGIPNRHAGQFFTPMSVARVMAGSILHDLPALVATRVQEAAERAGGQASTEVRAWLALPPDDQARSPLSRRALATIAAHVEPVRILDVLVGASAVGMESWMTIVPVGRR
jgi:hypothetical protein